ncbi:hypothetical protein N798_14020 [Knoellia flava TL1]|uniref:Uncharacterized protein n=2 Tax=Knoellia flava TaxID=913969 RepID=A0A8H9FXT1_9MICO|nr:hypothetical protein [Knoellia flava]KGN29426.1 hypothetical protein N798_14020 [Knoellia flava TL1]GGB86736.1 hypothetical protein GCM10011314_28180 [Knoellia flava]
MTLDLTDERLDAAVARLDPSSPTLTASEQHHADDLRARILASAPDANVLGRPPVPLPPSAARRRRTRWVLAGGAVAATTAALVIVPQLGDEATRPTAWSATPTALSRDDARELGEACLDTTQTLMSRPHSTAEGSFDPEQRRAMRVVVAERRGPYDAVVLGNAAGFNLTCLTFATDGWGPTVSGSQFPLVAPARDSASVGSDATSKEGLVDGRFRRETANIAYGRVGADVTGVELDTPAGRVTASVTHGWFAASWPSADPLDVDPMSTVRMTLTLADGRMTGPTAYDALPQRDVPAELQSSPAPS